MIVTDKIISLRSQVKQWRDKGYSVAFVPTMGHLHAGHISLVNAAREKADKVVVSIFVNPLQFNEVSDFSAYPKTLEADQEKLALAKADLLFLPESEAMYPQGQDSISKVSVPNVGDELEGECRPGHFDGVATIVLKLFNLVQPDMAFFGEKDFQQLLLVRKMVKDLNLPVEIHAVTTLREADGLAMSSRNSRLTEKQRQVAPNLYAVLEALVVQLKEGDVSISALEEQAKETLKNLGLIPEYVSVRDCDSLFPAENKSGNRVVLAAARLGDIRLIDNLRID